MKDICWTSQRLCGAETDLTSSIEKFKPRAIMNGHADFEILLLRSLTHRNIMVYLDAFVDVQGESPKASIITEYADLGNLEDYYNSARIERRPFSEAAIWHLFAQLADALAYLYYGVLKASSKNEHERRKDPNWLAIYHRYVSRDLFLDLFQNSLCFTFYKTWLVMHIYLRADMLTLSLEYRDVYVRFPD